LGIEAFCAQLSELPGESHARRDLVVLSHVLEHLVDVRGALEAAAALLMPQGQIYIEVPDPERYPAYPFVPFYYFDAEHINHFDLASLHRLAEGAGMEIAAAGSKLLRVDEGKDYPAVYAVLKRKERNGSGIAPPPAARRAVEAYVAWSKAGGKDRFDELARDRRPVIIWGAGSYAQRLLAGSRLADCNLVAIVDSDSSKHGKKLHGLAIRDPESGLSDAPPDAVIVIAAVLHARTIRQTLEAMGERRMSIDASRSQ
jgi:hypothetical protein